MSWVSLRVDPDDEPGGGIVRVPAHVNGRAIEAVLDTGAASSTLPASAGIAGLPAVRRSSSGTAFGRHTSDRVTVQSLVFGGIEHGPLVVERDPGETSLVGLDVLGRHRLHLDLDAGRLGLDEGDHVGHLHVLELGRNGHPHLTLHWGDAVSAYAVLDTGASVTVADSGFARRNPALFKEVGASQGTDAAGVRQDGQVYTVAGPTIEGLEFAAHTAAVVDLGFVNDGAERPVDLIVGYPLLRQAIWTLDLSEGTWAARLR